MNDIYVLQQDSDLSAPKLNLYISSIDRFKLGCKTSGYSSNNIMTVPHIPAAAHGYVLLNVNPFHENGGTPFLRANLIHPIIIRLARYSNNW